LSPSLPPDSRVGQFFSFFSRGMLFGFLLFLPGDSLTLWKAGFSRLLESIQSVINLYFLSISLISHPFIIFNYHHLGHNFSSDEQGVKRPCSTSWRLLASLQKGDTKDCFPPSPISSPRNGPASLVIHVKTTLQRRLSFRH